MKKARYWLSTIALVLLASGLTFVITYTQVSKKAQQTYAPYVNSYELTQKVAEVGAYIDTFFIGEYDASDMGDAVAEAMVEATGDRWSYYISADELESYYENVSNSYVGIGVTVTYAEEEGGLLVKEVTKDGPAAQAGIQIGDVITAVGEESTVELGLEESKKRIRGTAGTTVTITILRDGETLELTLTRSSIQTEVVHSELLEDGIGYITIANFEQNCAAQTISAIEALMEQGATSLLFDVRFNPGGLKTELCTLLDYLLPEGTIFQSVDYSGKEEVVTSDASCVNLPMAVLVNEDSYSAAEFFAAALQEYGVATIVGQKTCGKGYFQKTYVLSDGSALALSSGAYFTPNGVSLADVGITPDIEVEMEDEQYYSLYYNLLEKADDGQLQAAIAALKEKISANMPE